MSRLKLWRRFRGSNLRVRSYHARLYNMRPPPLMFAISIFAHFYLSFFLLLVIMLCAAVNVNRVFSDAGSFVYLLCQHRRPSNVLCDRNVRPVFLLCPSLSSL